MTRDEAIKIAARGLRARDYTTCSDWASAVVARADFLLAAMGEDHPSGPSIDRKLKKYARGMAEAEQSECCAAQARITEAATEARVVAEIGAYFREIEWSGAASLIERGDWRAKGDGR